MRAVGLIAVTLASGLFLSGCGGDPVDAISKATPAGGDTLTKYSEAISDAVSLSGNADLVQRFCVNGFKTPCPTGVTAMLSDAGFPNGGSAVDLAHVFVTLVADKKDGEADYSSSDEDYFWAAYQVALGREPGADGALDNLRFIQDTGERKTMLRSLLVSPEFRKQK